MGEPEPEPEPDVGHFMMTDCVRETEAASAVAATLGGVIGGVGNLIYCICGNCCSLSQLPATGCIIYGGVLYGV